MSPCSLMTCLDNSRSTALRALLPTSYMFTTVTRMNSLHIPASRRDMMTDNLHLSMTGEFIITPRTFIQFILSRGSSLYQAVQSLPNTGKLV